jgi:hypothetical protein
LVKKVKRLHLLTFTCLLFTLASPALAQQGISFTAEVNREAISTDQQLTLTLTVSGNYQQLGRPQLPLLSGFEVVGSSQSSQFSMINGVTSQKMVYTYRLQPTGADTFTIDPVSIQIDGATYQTDPITVQVSQGAAPTQSPAQPSQGQAPQEQSPATPGEGLAGQDVYIEADVDNPTPVVGQQIVYRFRFYQGVNLFDQPRLEQPTFSGFWTQDLAPNNVYEQIVAERRYRVTEVRWALFPTAAGQVTIEPSQLTIPGGFFSRDTTLATEPVDVNIRPLPEGAPGDFAGAVGQFEITAWAEPTKTRVNEPVTLFVRVSGVGNLNALPDPTAGAEERLADWRVYDAQTTTNTEQDGDTIRGDKLFERLLVPKTEGDLSLPAFALAYFDPQTSEYRQVETQALVIHVAPGENDKQAVVLLAGDIRHIKAAPPALATRRTPYLERPLYWLGWIAPLLAVVGVWTWERRRQRLSSDVAYARAQRARRLARKRLAQARKQAREDEDAAYTAVARALGDYLGDKFNLPPAGLTRDAIRQALEQHAVPGALIERALAGLDWADSGRFAPMAAGRDVGELVDEAEDIVAELERSIGGRE